MKPMQRKRVKLKAGGGAPKELPSRLKKNVALGDFKYRNSIACTMICRGTVETAPAYPPSIIVINLSANAMNIITSSSIL